MEYTDDELRRWWNGLANSRREELLDTIEECANSDWMLDVAARLQTQPASATPRELKAVRKWDT